MENVGLKITASEATWAFTSDSHMKAKVTIPSVHTNGGTYMRYPSEESISQQKHIQATLSYQKPVLCPLPFHHSVSHTNSTRIRANVCYPTRPFLQERALSYT